MLIEKIELKNFISCKNISIKLPLGFIGVFGKNGSGKSTIFRDAMFYSIYGETIRTKTPKDYIRRGSSAFTLDFSFKINQEQYSIYRSFNDKNKRQVSLSINGIEENSLKTDIQKYLNEKIGVDSTLFMQTTMISPNSECLLDLSKADRKKFFYKLLQLEKFDKMHEVANKKNNELNKRSIILEHELNKKDQELLSYSKELEDILKEKEAFDQIIKEEKNIIQYNESKKLREYIFKQAKESYDITLKAKEELSKFYSQEEIKALRNMDSKLAEVLEQVSIIKGQIKNNEVNKNKLESLLSKADDATCPTCEQSLDLDAIRLTLSNIDSTIADSNTALLKLNAKQNKIKLCSSYLDNKVKYLELKSKYDILNNASMNQKNINIEDLLDSKNKLAKITLLNKKINSIQEDIKNHSLELENNNEKQALLANIIKFALETPEYIIDSVFKSIMKKANELLNLLPNKQILDEEDLNNSINIYATSSTGEMFKLNIILRIALNIILSDILKKNKIEFLILDEGGLGNLDKTISIEIVNILSTLISADVLKQIILITHQEELLEFCNHKYYIENKNEGTSILKL